MLINFCSNVLQQIEHVLILLPFALNSEVCRNSISNFKTYTYKNYANAYNCTDILLKLLQLKICLNSAFARFGIAMKRHLAASDKIELKY